MHGEIDRATWTPPPIFGLIGELGGVALTELERTFNEGLGMVAVMAPDDGRRGRPSPRGPRGPGVGVRARARRHGRRYLGLPGQGRRGRNRDPGGGARLSATASARRQPSPSIGRIQVRRRSAARVLVRVVVLVVVLDVLRVGIVVVGVLGEVVAVDRTRKVRTLRARPGVAPGPWSGRRTSAGGRPSSAWPWLGRAPWLDPLLRCVPGRCVCSGVTRHPRLPAGGVIGDILPGREVSRPSHRVDIRCRVSRVDRHSSAWRCGCPEECPAKMSLPVLMGRGSRCHAQGRCPIEYVL